MKDFIMFVIQILGVALVAISCAAYGQLMLNDDIAGGVPIVIQEVVYSCAPMKVDK